MMTSNTTFSDYEWIEPKSYSEFQIGDEVYYSKYIETRPLLEKRIQYTIKDIFSREEQQYSRVICRDGRTYDFRLSSSDWGSISSWLLKRPIQSLQYDPTQQADEDDDI